MVDKNKLYGIMISKGLNGKQMAENLGMNRMTFYKKVNDSTFRLNEVYKIIRILDIQDPREIFFANEVSSKDTL